MPKQWNYGNNIVESVKAFAQRVCPIRWDIWWAEALNSKRTDSSVAVNVAK